MPIQADQRKPKKTQYVGTADKEAQKVSARWWLLPKDKIHTGVSTVVEHILTNMSVRRRMNYFFAALYNDLGAQFTSSRHTNLYYNRTALDGNAVLGSSITLNVLQNCIDTACALISKNKPKPQFLTEGSKDYATKVKGKELTRYVEGIFDETNMYQVAQKVFLDACIYGTGALKLFIEDGEIRAENIFIEEILVDDLEGMHEAPVQLHQRKYIARDILCAQFPECEEEIRSCQEISGGTTTTADVIAVRESWHLRSGKKSKDGMHAITIENCTLYAEPFTKDTFPILFFRWAFQTLGFWGRGICHETWKLQRELDIILQTIQRSQRLVSGPIIAVESGSNITEDHITSNRLGKIVEYSVTPPQFLTPPSVNAELYNHANYLEDRIYKVAGVSQAAAQGEKQKEVKSAIAIREANDITAGRFEITGQRWERFHMDIAKLLVDLSCDLSKEKSDLSVMTTGKGSARRINFKDVKSELEDYKLQLFPVSGLPSTPAGKLDQLMDYAQAGYLSKEQVMDIADFPDLEDTISLETASLHLTQDILSNIKLHGDYIAPGPYMTLPIAYRMACLEVDRATLQNVDEDNIELLRKWADACQDLMDEGKAQAAAAQAGMAQQNMGTPSQQGSAAVGSQMVGPGAPPPTPGAPPPMPPSPEMPQ